MTDPAEMEDQRFEVWAKPANHPLVPWRLVRSHEDIERAAERWGVDVRERAFSEAKIIGKTGYESEVRENGVVVDA